MARRKSKGKSTAKNIPPPWHPVYLKGSFMVTAILGFFISAYYVYPLSVNYGVSFMIVFILMLIAAVISMTKAPVPEHIKVR